MLLRRVIWLPATVTNCTQAGGTPHARLLWVDNRRRNERSGATELNFSNLKIATKIGAGFAIIVAMIMALGAIAWYQLGAVAAGEEQLATNNLPSVEIAAQIQSLVNAVRRLEARHVLTYDLKAKDALEVEMAADRQQLAGIDSVASSLYHSEVEKKAWTNYLVHRNAWYAEWEKLRPFSLRSPTQH